MSIDHCPLTIDHFRRVKPERRFVALRRDTLLLTCACVALFVCSGCGFTYSDKAKLGVVYFIPGAGNIDGGDAGVRKGLDLAGYKGEVATLVWTISLNPAIDQTIRLNARLQAKRLSNIIADYIDKYPGRPVNLVGLSAGTGIAVWALEGLDPKYKVDNVVLLSSSLHHEYDVGKALEHVKGRIYCYYSSEDAILALPMKVFGSIDGKFGVDGAGAVGLHSPHGQDRVVNVRWTNEFTRYGYYGGHTDSTSPAFVRAVLSKHILSSQPPAASDAALATEPETAPPVASRD